MARLSLCSFYAGAVLWLSSQVCARALGDLDIASLTRLIPRNDWPGFPTTIVDSGNDALLGLTGDNPDYDYPDPEPTGELCKRAFTVRCVVPRPDECYTTTDPSQQKEFKLLNARQREKVWQYASDRGRRLKKSMDRYVTQKISRLSEPSGAAQENNAAKFYATRKDPIKPKKISDEIQGMKDCFNQALCSVDGDDEFPFIEVFPLRGFMDAEKQMRSVAELGASGEDSVIISTRSSALNDGNEPGDRAYSSTLTWLAWRQIAGEDQYKALKYHMRAWIANAETVNIMALAHTRFPEKVSLEGYQSMTPIEAGHGTWRPGDEAYDALLASPNVKISVNLIIDRNPEMDNPYIAEIHTFGYYSKRAEWWETRPISPAYVRQPCIIIKYGPAPPEVLAQQVAPTDTIETS